MSEIDKFERRTAEAIDAAHHERREEFARLQAENERLTKLMKQMSWEKAELAYQRDRAEASAAVKVKPLEWKEERHSECSAETIVGTYEVGFDDGWWAQLEGGVKWDWEPEFDPRSYYGSGAAKAAAQADYERRILSALTTQPATPPEAAYAIRLGRNNVIDMGGFPSDEPVNDAVITVRAKDAPQEAEALAKAPVLWAYSYLVERDDACGFASDEDERMQSARDLVAALSPAQAVTEAQAIRDKALEEAADIADARRAAWMDAAHSRSQPPYPLPTHFQTERAGEAEFLASAIRAKKGATP